jgi:two-component system OmpR family response regulator
MTSTVLVVDDDAPTLDVIARSLAGEGYAVDRATDLRSARERLATNTFSVIVIDRILPDGDGQELLEDIKRAKDRTPVMMLTARGELGDRVSCLRAGADSYLVKPYELDELLAVVAALVRRHRETSYTDGDLRIDFLAREVWEKARRVDLTPMEFLLIARLAATPGSAVTRSELLASVWEMDSDSKSGVVEVHITRLRGKLGAQAHCIQTVRGVGYRLRASNR